MNVRGRYIWSDSQTPVQHHTPVMKGLKFVGHMLLFFFVPFVLLFHYITKEQSKRHNKGQHETYLDVEVKKENEVNSKG